MNHTSNAIETCEVKSALGAPIIFVHLPKCGGTTLNRLIEWEYSPTRVCSIDPSFFRWSYRRILRWSTQRLGRMKVFQGHMPFGLHRMLPQPAAYMTMLRDPVDRGISEYYYALSRVVHPEHRTMKKMMLEEYIQLTPYANVQTKLIAGLDPGYDFLGGDCTDATLSLAKENLTKYFTVVGLTERFEETLALAKIRFGWKIRNYAAFNVTKGRPKKDQVPSEVRAAIAERYQYDMQIYDYAVALFNAAIARNRDRVSEELGAIADAKEVSTPGAYYFRAASSVRKGISRIHSYI